MDSATRWVRARDIGLTILIWLAIIYVAFQAVGHIFTAVILLVLGALLAYVLTPLVKLLSRVVPRWLAITVVYVIALGLVGALGYVIVSTAIAQLQGFSGALPGLLGTAGSSNPLYQALHGLGISDNQFNTERNQVLNWLQGAGLTVAGLAVPIITGVAGALLDVILVLVMSIYLVVDGPRVVGWLRTRMPSHQRSRVNFTLSIINRNVGGYVRGQLILTSLIGVLVGGGMAALQVPYAILLGVLAFILEFIPFLGVFISGAICALVALSRGWLTAVIVVAYFIVVHVIEGDVVGPRIIGRALGLHPVIGLFALIAGADLFGIWGALFAAPVAGVIQSVISAIWTEWRLSHPEQFPNEHADETAGHVLTKPSPGVFATAESSSLMPHPVDTPADIRAREGENGVDATPGDDTGTDHEADSAATPDHSAAESESAAETASAEGRPAAQGEHAL